MTYQDFLKTKIAPAEEAKREAPALFGYVNRGGRVMVLCNECAAKVRLNLLRHDLEPIGDGMAYKRCDHCRKGRYCLELELVRGTDGAGGGNRARFQFKSDAVHLNCP